MASPTTSIGHAETCSQRRRHRLRSAYPQRNSPTDPGRHPFLDDLTVDAELVSSVLRSPVIRRDDIRLAVDTVGTFYVSQTPTFLHTVGSQLLLSVARLDSAKSRTA